MKTVKLTQTREETVEVEVDFPVYRHTDYLGDTGYSTESWTRVSEDGRSVEVECDQNGRGEVKWAVATENRVQLSGNREYALGEGEYFCSAEDFDEALRQAREFVTGLTL